VIGVGGCVPRQHGRPLAPLSSSPPQTGARFAECGRLSGCVQITAHQRRRGSQARPPVGGGGECKPHLSAFLQPCQGVKGGVDEVLQVALGGFLEVAQGQHRALGS
jgi:hypothetical protein